MIFFPLFLLGQTSLTLEQCVKLALKNNHEFKQVLLEKQKADEQVSEAYGSALYPSIDGSIDYTRAIKRPIFIFDINGITQEFEMGSANTATASVNLEQPLFTGAMFLAVRIAETYANIQQKSVDYSEADMIMRVKQGYYTYLLAGEFVKLAQLQLERAAENMKNTKFLYGAGLAEEYDYIQATVQHQNLIPALSQTKNQMSQAQNNLLLLIGMQPTDKIVINDSLKFTKLDFPTFEAGLDSMYKNNDLIQQKELEIKLNDLVKSYEWSEHLPKINLLGKWQTQSQEEDTRHFGDWRYRSSFNVGVVLRVPLFKGFTINSKVEQAELDLKISIEGLAQMKRTVRNELENTVLQLKSTVEQKDAYKIAVSEASRGYDIALKRYSSGLGTQLEVTTALLDNTRAKVNYLQSLHDYYVQAAKIDMLLGKKLNDVKF